MNLALSPGGSSSGEGALLALRGAPFGTGTDVGGSSRIPAHFCGIYSLKPTSSRVSQSGHRPITPGQVVIGESIAPMAGELDALETVITALVNSNWSEIDTYVAPVKWTIIEVLC